MSVLNRASLLSFSIGVLIVMASAAWWWITYGDVIRYDYLGPGEASVCLIGDSEICRLARALCRGAHPATIVAYSAAAFWAGMAVLSTSLVTLGLRPVESKG